MKTRVIVFIWTGWVALRCFQNYCNLSLQVCCSVTMCIILSKRRCKVKGLVPFTTTLTDSRAFKCGKLIIHFLFIFMMNSIFSKDIKYAVVSILIGVDKTSVMWAHNHLWKLSACLQQINKCRDSENQSPANVWHPFWHFIKSHTVQMVSVLLLAAPKERQPSGVLWWVIWFWIHPCNCCLWFEMKQVTRWFKMNTEKVLPLFPGGSWLATIAKLTGLIPLLSSFPSAGSCLHLFLLLPRTPPPQFDSFHALHSTGHKSLSFTLLPSHSVYIISICLMYAVLFAAPMLSVSLSRTPSLDLLPLLLFQIGSYLLSFMSSLFLPLIFHCCFTFFPSQSTLLSLYSLLPNPLICFTGAAHNSLPAHFSWLRCSTTFKYNIEAIMRKPYTT